jgi:site-specific DNA-methyltransferase (adenine-specific)
VIETAHTQLYCDNALNIISTLSDIDAVITDPPYSSGGFTRSDKAQKPSDKYQSSDHIKIYPEFFGDNLDQRSWQHWMTMLFADCFKAMKDGAYFMAFSDWRQLPSMTDIIQMAGFFWRGIVVWDKTKASRAPHCGYFRHQCEYIVWGTKGQISRDNVGPFPGVIECLVNANEKLHMTGKPLKVMQELIKPIKRGQVILDPFMGSGTTGEAAVIQGCRFIGIELAKEYFDISVKRIQEAEGIEKTGYRQINLLEAGIL